MDDVPAAPGVDRRLRGRRGGGRPLGLGLGRRRDLRLGLRDGAGAAQQALGLVDRDLLLRLRGAEERARGEGGFLVGELGGVDAAVLLRRGFLGRAALPVAMSCGSSCSLRSFSSMRLPFTAAGGVVGGEPTMPLVMTAVKRLSKRKM